MNLNQGTSCGHHGGVLCPPTTFQRVPYLNSWPCLVSPINPWASPAWRGRRKEHLLAAPRGDQGCAGYIVSVADEHQKWLVSFGFPLKLSNKGTLKKDTPILQNSTWNLLCRQATWDRRQAEQPLLCLILRCRLLDGIP